MSHTHMNVLARYKASACCLTFLQFLQLFIHASATYLNAQGWFGPIDLNLLPVWTEKWTSVDTWRGLSQCEKNIKKEVELGLQCTSNNIAGEYRCSGMQYSKYLAMVRVQASTLSQGPRQYSPVSSQVVNEGRSCRNRDFRGPVWCSWLVPPLLWRHAMWAPSGIPATVLLIWLPADAPGKTVEDGASGPALVPL